MLRYFWFLMVIDLARFTESEVALILDINKSEVRQLLSDKKLVGYRCPKDVLRITTGSVMSMINNGHFRTDMERARALESFKEILYEEG